MNKQNLTRMIVTAVCVVFLAFTGSACKRSPQNDSHEIIVREFWQFALNNEIDKAYLLTNDYEPDLLSINPYKESGIGRGFDRLGKEHDLFFTKSIYDYQIKIERIKEAEVRDYRIGMKVVVVYDKGYEGEYLVCLAQTKLPGNPWRIYRSTPLIPKNVYGNEMTVEDECFEKPEK
jgi:hypothetical protein